MNGTIMPSAMLELESQAVHDEYWDEMDWEATNHDEVLDEAVEMTTTTMRTTGRIRLWLGCKTKKPIKTKNKNTIKRKEAKPFFIL